MSDGQGRAIQRHRPASYAKQRAAASSHPTTEALTEARELIQKHGYGRRDEELADAEQWLQS